MHDFNRDLYDCILKVCIIGYLRPEKNFDSLDSLISAIHKDIKDAEELLESPESLKLKNHTFFNADDVITTNGHNGCKKSELNGHKAETNGINGNH